MKTLWRVKKLERIQELIYKNINLLNYKQLKFALDKTKQIE